MSISIGLDTCPICGDAVGGIPTFIRQLIPNLLRLDGANRYYQCYKLSRIKGLGSLYPVSPEFKRIWYDKRFLFPLRNLDVFHGTAEWLPPGLRIPRVMTVHDLRGIRSKDDIDECCKDQVRSLMDSSVHIATVSHFIRNQLLERLAISGERISAVHLAGDPFFRPLEGAVKKDRILFVGTIAPNKNVLGLVRAFDAIRERWKETILVLCGRQNNRRYLSEIREFIQSREGLAERILWVADAGREMVRRLYNESRVFIMPSRYEGFGLPVLEAQACGCPVVCSSIGPFVEIGGESVIYCDHESIESIAAALESLLQSEPLGRELAARGLANNGRFSWEKTARKYADLYARLGSSGL